MTAEPVTPADAVERLREQMLGLDFANAAPIEWCQREWERLFAALAQPAASSGAEAMREAASKVARRDRRSVSAIMSGYEPDFHKLGREIAEEIAALPVAQPSDAAAPEQHDDTRDCPWTPGQTYEGDLLPEQPADQREGALREALEPFGRAVGVEINDDGEHWSLLFPRSGPQPTLAQVRRAAALATAPSAESDQ